MKLSLFKYAVLLHPKKKDGEYEGETKLLLAPDVVLAKDEKQARIKIARKVPEESMNELDMIEILVGPF